MTAPRTSTDRAGPEGEPIESRIALVGWYLWWSLVGAILTLWLLDAHRWLLGGIRW